jgi:hypothetical protein
VGSCVRHEMVRRRGVLGGRAGLEVVGFWVLLVARGERWGLPSALTLTLLVCPPAHPSIFFVSGAAAPDTPARESDRIGSGSVLKLSGDLLKSAPGAEAGSGVTGGLGQRWTR